MSRVYIHSRKYHRYSRRTVVLLGLCFLLSVGIIAAKLYFGYNGLTQASQSQISNNETSLTGYINPYFLFKDSSKWIQDKTDSTANMIVYNQYVSGQPSRQLVVYLNQTPSNVALASTRVLTVKIVNGDSLSADRISAACSSLLPAGQKSVQEVTISGITMFCDPSPQDYSVILGVASGSYQLKMSTAKTSTNFIVLYRDNTGHPDPNEIINIANSFKAI